MYNCEKSNRLYDVTASGRQIAPCPQQWRGAKNVLAQRVASGNPLPQSGRSFRKPHDSSKPTATARHLPLQLS
eukprot:scaffold34618_cov159-Amphora_coffeaeformis.AAC.2